MQKYILLLPILFIFHDMEEIIGFGWFFRKNPQLFSKYPKVTKAYRDYTTEGMALAVYEEFIPFFGISLLAYFLENTILYVFWYGLLLSLTAHFVVHIGQSILLKTYIPSLLTSLICLPVCVQMLLKTADDLTFDRTNILLILLSIILMLLNLKFAHHLMHQFGKRLHDPTPK